MAVGTVYIVGAGPGDPGLITVRGRECLAAADVVVYDRLVGDRLLALAKPGARLIYVGKQADHHTLKQGQINDLLVTEAEAGHVVVRLKGGDPFVFGRGGEEVEALAARGLPFVVVPGITSAIAGPAYAGIPVTHRGLATSVTIVTAHEDPTKDESQLDWQRLAQGADTLVFLMGVERLDAVAAELVRHGRPAATPAALVRWASRPEQETLVATLGDIGARAAEAGSQPPAVLVVGEVVRLRERLRWFDSLPLFGKRVLVTRTREQASALSALLAAKGARVWELPTIAIVPPASFEPAQRALDNLAEYDWVVFTSANGVERALDYLMMRGKDARVFANCLIAAIGPATAAALAQHGLRADYVPSDFVAEAVLAGLLARGVAGKRVLLARAAQARVILAEGLRQAGADVDDVALYDTALPRDVDPEAVRLLREDAFDVITFTSSSTVRNFADLCSREHVQSTLARATVACIGPITVRTAREAGLRVDVQASEYTVPGLVRSLEKHFAALGPARDR
ncbi:MAG: uroporphyrinogen-III C-methyltransferase [Chloroflexi bacterium]|nr:uroporphyrinogen-III C-methyltransferase [Chloroflexota bacterium]